MAGQHWGSRWFSSFFVGDPSLYAALRESAFGFDHRFVPPGWSISWEFFGSIALLISCLLFREYRRGIIFGGVILVARIWVGEDAIYPMAIFLGYCINNLKSNKAMCWIAVIIGSILGAYTPLSPLYQELPKLYLLGYQIFRPKDFYNLPGGFLVVYAISNGFGQKILSHGILLWLGRVSFSLYITHFTLLASFVASLSLLIKKSAHDLTGLLFIYIFFALTLAGIFEFFVDRPAINLSRSVADRLMKVLRIGNSMRLGV